MTHLTEWVIEETNNESGEVKVYKYTDYSEALEIFQSFKENTDVTVSLQKKQKRLLNEAV